MRPYQKIAKMLPMAALSICALSAIHCGEDKTEETAGALSSGNSANVSLQMNYSSAPLIDSLVLDCFGDDSLHYTTDPTNPYIDIELFPNESWHFVAKLYANGNLMQIGELTTALQAGTSVELDIQMHAINGFVYIEIPLGFGNPTGIASGSLVLDDGEKKYITPMEIEGNNAIFKSSMLPLNQDYTIELSLKDEAGNEIYRTSDSFRLDETSPVPELQIKSLRAKVSFAIGIADDVNMELNLTLPAGKRKPKVGDVVISEFLSAPTANDSSQYEFVEIYNGSIDTLDLENCTLGTTSIASKAWNIESTQIMPGEVMVFGDTSAKTPAKYFKTDKWSNLTNSKGSIVIQCNNIVLDSLFYSSEPDSLGVSYVPALSSSKNGLSAQLNINVWEDRDKFENWCLGLPTPGTLSFCE